MVWERIRKLEEQEQQRIRDDTVKKEADRITKEREASIKAQRDTQERERKERERRRINKEVFEKSGTLSAIKELDNGLYGNVRKHAIIGSIESGSVELAWGNKFKVTDKGTIDYEKPLIGKGVKDYSYIEVAVDSSDESIEINGRTVKKDQWQTDKTIIKDLLAQAYRNPHRVNDRETPPSRYSSDSSGSTNTECCNN